MSVRQAPQIRPSGRSRLRDRLLLAAKSKRFAALWLRWFIGNRFGKWLCGIRLVM